MAIHYPDFVLYDFTLFGIQGSGLAVVYYHTYKAYVGVRGKDDRIQGGTTNGSDAPPASIVHKII